MHMYKYILGYKQVCPVCKKTFLIINRNEYAWKIKNKFFCGWNCMCKYRAEDKQPPYLKGEKYKG